MNTKTKDPRLDIVDTAHRLAAEDSARYMLDAMPTARALKNRGEHLGFAVAQAPKKGFIVEFGVANGRSLTTLARLAPDRTIYGFDSFQGLPADWTTTQHKGRFSRNGEPPQLPVSNVELFVGMFEDTIDAFLKVHSPQQAALIHVDCDLYESAWTVLTKLDPMIVHGTIILFDEYWNYPGWQHHEFRAFQDFAGARQGEFSYRYLAFNRNGSGVSVRIEPPQPVDDPFGYTQ